MPLVLVADDEGEPFAVADDGGSVKCWQEVEEGEKGQGVEGDGDDGDGVAVVA